MRELLSNQREGDKVEFELRTVLTGKIFFLHYLLVYLVSHARLVALCHLFKDTWFLLDPAGVNVYSFTKNKMSSQTVALFDETPPSPDFFNPFSQCRAMLVQATSPTEARYKQWAKQLQADFWVLKPWDLSEIQDEVEYRSK